MKTIQETFKVANDLKKKLYEIGYEQIDVKSTRVLNCLYEVHLSDAEDTLTLTPKLLETCMMYCHLEYLTYFVWLNPVDGRLTLTIR